jgi:glutaminase
MMMKGTREPSLMPTLSNDNRRDDLSLLVGDLKSAASPIRQHLIELHRKHLPLRDGTVASYIPELARANPDWFAIAAVTTSGQKFAAGDIDQQFTIQSISKPFVYGLALQELGRDAVAQRVGVEPTGDAFNSLIHLDEKSKRPHNPMVNAGAIATADLIRGADATDRLRKLLKMFETYTGRAMHVDMSAFVSERASGHRNRAIAHLMLNFGMVSDNVEETLDLYFQQCSMLVNCQDLAMMAATLANGGVNPVTGQRALASEYLRDVLSVMYTCGMYDYAGEWAYTVGIPAKSGVSGGILAVVPGRMGIAVFSPPLDARGNSMRGIRVCEELSRDLGLHIFDATPERSRKFSI